MFSPFQILPPSANLASFTRPAVMGILNLTPDSFYADSRFVQLDAILDRAALQIAEGCDILDIGGMSSRPGAKTITEQEESDRVLAAIEAIHSAWPEMLISIDTWRAKVAEYAVHAGASIVNDISAGGMDAGMFLTVARLQVPYILMHMQGNPQTMQVNPSYQSITTDLLQFFTRKLSELRQLGVKDIWIDPGFGFGKTVEHNFLLLTRLDVFSQLQCPILVGLSRKSMICKSLAVKPEHALNGTTALHMVALMRGARILRVHDVKEAVEVVKLWQQMG